MLPGLLRPTTPPGCNRWHAARTIGCAAPPPSGPSLGLRPIHLVAAQHTTREGGSVSQLPSPPSLSVCCPNSMLQHILNKYPISSRRILYKHMGHRPHQFPVLYDGAAAHSLHNSPGNCQQFRICHLDYHTFILMGCCIIHLLNLDLIVFYDS